MLRWRLILGAVLIAAVALLCWLDFHAARPGIYLFPLALVAAVLGAGELVGLWRDLPHPPRSEVIYGGTLLVVLASGCATLELDFGGFLFYNVVGAQGVALAVVTMWALVAEMRRYQQPGGVAIGTALSVFGVTYLGLLLSFVVALRTVPYDGQLGLMALASMILVVKMTDIGAYTIGRLFGRHKMTPVLSPGKTWEGFAGGIAFAVASSYVFFQVVLPVMNLTKIPSNLGWLIYGVVIAIAGTLGDLTESLLKRDAGRKDSSTWMPGFGGVLDLLDSILFAAPVAYVCWVLGVVGR